MKLQLQKKDELIAKLSDGGGMEAVMRQLQESEELCDELREKINQLEAENKNAKS